VNVFYLDTEPSLAARAQCDAHVVKMPLETAQMLCTIARGVAERAGDAPPEGLYRATHARHPSTLWAGQSAANAAWLASHGKALCAEYTRRFGKVHASLRVIDLTADILHGALPGGQAMTPPPLAMPDEFKRPDPVQAYRDYYRWKAVTLSRFRYTRAVPPAWLEGVA
jgi:hypothetical protein